MHTCLIEILIIRNYGINWERPRQIMADVDLEDFLTGKPTVNELYEHVRVGTNWHKLGVLLKLDITKLNEIRSLNEDSDFKALKMFELWLSSNPNATRREIIETLQKDALKENTIAEEYKKASTKSKNN